jgi:hypothetical protein
VESAASTQRRRQRALVVGMGVEGMTQTDPNAKHKNFIQQPLRKHTLKKLTWL